MTVAIANPHGGGTPIRAVGTEVDKVGRHEKEEVAIA